MFNVFKLHVPVFGLQRSLLMSVLLHMSTLCLCTTISASNPLRTVYTCIMQVAAQKQPSCPSNTRRWLRQFLVIYRCLDRGGGGGGCPDFDNGGVVTGKRIEALILRLSDPELGCISLLKALPFTWACDNSIEG